MRGYMNSPQNNKLSIYEATRVGFKTTLDNFFLFFKAILVSVAAIIGALLGIGLLGAIFLLLTRAAFLKWNTLGKPYFMNLNVLEIFFIIVVAICTLAILFFLSALIAGFIKMSLEVFEKGASRINVLFSCKDLSIRLVLLHMLVCIITAFGLALLVVPGIYWMIRYSFAPYAMVDKNLGVMESLRYSWQLTKTNKWNLLGLVIVQTIITAIAGLTYVGFIITLPATLLMTIYAYHWQQATTAQQ